MSQSAIKVTDLSKAYIIQHNNESAASSSLREVITKKVSGFFNPKSNGESPAVQAEKFWALQDLSFDVERGSRMGILGGNGAGKSTLLKIISKITEPTSGQIEVNGRVVSLLEVGTGFHPELTGRENVFLNGVILGMKRSEIKKKFDEIVDFAEIEQFLDTPVKRYSSGMYMRLAFAVAAHLEPEILIIDEVLAVGDAQFQKKCIAKMDEISRADGRTVLFVSHNLEAVSSFCTSGIYLKKGKIVMQGDIDDVAEQYAKDNTENKPVFAPHKTKAIYFNSVETLRRNVRFGEELILKCEVVTNQNLDRYIIGITISDYFENKVGTTLITGRKYLLTGLNHLSIKIPTGNIVPGNYKIAISLALDENLNNEDVIFDHPTFSIIASNIRDSFAIWHPAWGGNFLANVEIS
ncbi:polysaccharide ABC transporter ATP-binding protein [Mucilaginibacter sp. CSA2-8R]|uniref:ABC transporter ATP-binding protein n=1 Tax=Mucilaginibacter sp. CSA2-8R TaxID=3141542 RepID=UPI00315D37C3